MTEPEQSEAKRGGRPRPQATIDQDQQVLNYLDSQRAEDGSFAGVTRKAIEEATGLPGNKVYLSIWRLKTVGEIVKVDGNKWAKVA